MKTHAYKTVGNVLLLFASIAIFSFTLLLLPRENLYPYILIISMVGIITAQHRILKTMTSILHMEQNTVYKYYGETDGENIILSRLKKDGTYEDGIYSKKNIEWFEGPILGATYIYEKSKKGRYFLFLHILEEKIEQENNQ